MARFDLYQEVTDMIVAELEKGVAPWVRPWQSLGKDSGGLPYNGYTARAYRGVNVWILIVTAGNRGYDDPRWFTFKQANLLGARIKKGERSVHVTFWRDLTVEEQHPETGVRTERTIPLLRSYSVFNAVQCEGVPKLYVPPDREPSLRYAELQGLVGNTGAKVQHGGNMAYYAVTDDRIQMPKLVAFLSEEHYWSTMLHELTHWTGHPARCNRQLANRFHADAYAMEELIAEIGSAFLCAHCRIDGRLQHAAYIDHWLKVLRSDKRAIFVTSTRAQQAADYLTERLATQPGAEQQEAA